MNFKFKGGPEPPAPGPNTPGPDPTPQGHTWSTLADLALGFDSPPNKVYGIPGSETTFDIYLTLAAETNPDQTSFEAWTFGMAIESCTLEGLKCINPKTGAEIGEGEPATGDYEGSPIPGSRGVIIYFGCDQNTVLQGGETVRIARVTLKGTIPERGCAPLVLRYVDGLKGKGQPYTNLVSMKGTPQIPSLATCTISLCAPFQLPGDANQDGKLDISDSLWLLGHLFLGTPGTEKLPCEGGTAFAPGPGDKALVDVNGDGRIDLSDPVAAINFLFLGGPPPAFGTKCVPILGCQDRCF